MRDATTDQRVIENGWPWSTHPALHHLWCLRPQSRSCGQTTTHRPFIITSAGVTNNYIHKRDNCQYVINNATGKGNWSIPMVLWCCSEIMTGWMESNGWACAADQNRMSTSHLTKSGHIPPSDIPTNLSLIFQLIPWKSESTTI